jgi:hypothetical protein
MVKKQALTVALVKSVLEVKDHLGRTEGRHRRRRHPRRRGCGRMGNQRQQPRVTLDLDRLRQIGGDPRSGSSHQPSADAPNPRVRVLEQSPSPSPNPPAYRPMEPLDPTASPRSRREPPCAIHGTGPCPYPVAQWQPVSSSPSEGEGEEVVIGEEEDEAAEEEDGVVVVAIIDKDD